MSIFFALAVPSIGQMQGELQGAWSGLWLEKQALGFHSCLALICSMAMMWRGRAYWPWCIGIVLSLIAIVGSQGVTALGMTAIAVATGLWIRLFYHGFASKLTGSWIAAFAALALIPALTGAFDAVLRLSGKTSDLSGRREIWEGVTTVADMRPMQGWGFQAIWRTKDDMTSPLQWILERADFVPANAHSSWLDIYLQLGQPGVILLAICMIWAWLSLFFKAKIDNRALAFSGATFAAITFISFSETNLVMPMDLQWALVCLLAVKLYLTPPITDTVQRPLIEPQTAQGSLDGDLYTYGDN
jgi:exopolysaccharide production protein ExoQ